MYPAQMPRPSSMEQWRGAAAAAGAIALFGSYAVPIRLPWVLALDIDPVVFQAYKTLVCFTSSFLALLFTDLGFTWWGLVGGGVWVVNGVAAINAVKLAGIGLAQSMWSGLSILVSFFWGAYVFHEPVHSIPMAYLSLFLMVTGMVGLSVTCAGFFNWSFLHSRQPAALLAPKEDGSLEIRLLDCEHPRVPDLGTKNFLIGAACAVFVGIFNGSLMVPLKYAHKHVTGFQYLLSFGIGAMISMVALLFFYHIWRWYLGKPPLCYHLGKGAAPALAAGCLWSAGNVCSLCATVYLGMALGWPLVQCQILVSSLWSVLYFQEVGGVKAKVNLLLSTAVIVAGAAMLFEFGTAS